MHEYEVGTETKNGLQRHRINADRHNVVDGALTFWKKVEDKYVTVAIFAADKWIYVTDSTVANS